MKKLLLIFSLAMLTVLALAISVSAEVTTYDDAPERTKYQCIDDEIVEFYDGFKCPVSYVLTDTSTIGTGDYNTRFEYFMDFTYINGKLGKTEEDGNLYTYADVKGFDIPTGITHVAKYAGIGGTTLKWITFPDTITSLSNAIFQNATGLEECTFKFSESNPMRIFPSYTFFGCKNLKAFSMPDCFTSMYDIAHFSGCTSLGAVHLSESLETWSSGGGGSRTASFDDCINMYFTNESFTYDSIPEKPEVYYFPANLETISNNSVCRECKNLNNVLVFGTKLTEMPNQYFFQGGPANKIVLLGDMTTVATKYWGGTTQIFFANPADKSLDDVSYSGGRTTVFCNAEGNTTHLAEKAAITPATCLTNEIRDEYCFCGASMGASEVENTALGHNHSIFVDIVYANYSADGYYSYKCERCDDLNNDKVADALFTCLGYSTKSYGNIGIAVGYMAKKEIISEYEGVTGKTVKYGVFAVSQSKLGENDVFGEDGTASDKAIVADLTSRERTAFEIKVTGFEDSQKDIKLAIGAYVSVSDENGTEYSYMQDSTKGEFSGKYYFASFNDIVGQE